MGRFSAGLRFFRPGVFTALWFFGTLAAGLGEVHAAEMSGDEKIVVEYPSDLSSQTVRVFTDLLAAERKRVRAWWGVTFEETIRVKIEDKRMPSMALVPAWRGEHGTMLMPLFRVRANNAATLHEIVHIYAPNANRFLAESIAVYAQEALKGRRAHPNFGRDLHDMAAATTGNVKLADLDRVPTPQPLARGEDEVHAYVAGGSFARFLIEREGLDKFRALYALTPLVPGRRNAGPPDRWQTIYGRSLADLEVDWRQFLRANLPQAAPPSTDRRRD